MHSVHIHIPFEALIPSPQPRFHTFLFCHSQWPSPTLPPTTIFVRVTRGGLSPGGGQEYNLDKSPVYLGQPPALQTRGAIFSFQSTRIRTFHLANNSQTSDSLNGSHKWQVSDNFPDQSPLRNHADFVEIFFDTDHFGVLPAFAK